MISSPTCIYKLVKVEKLWREAFRSLYNYLSLMDIVCLKTTLVLTYQVSDELKSHLFLVHFSVLFLVRIE